MRGVSVLIHDTEIIGQVSLQTSYGRFSYCDPEFYQRSGGGGRVWPVARIHCRGNVLSACHPSCPLTPDCGLSFMQTT